MATFDVGHPDVFDFIRAKRDDGRLRQFNLSLLITTDFVEAVKADADWPLAFPMTTMEYASEKPDLNNTDKVIWREWPIKEGYVTNDAGQVACRVSRIVPARRLWDSIFGA